MAYENALYDWKPSNMYLIKKMHAYFYLYCIDMWYVFVAVHVEIKPNDMCVCTTTNEFLTFTLSIIFIALHIVWNPCRFYCSLFDAWSETDSTTWKRYYYGLSMMCLNIASHSWVPMESHRYYQYKANKERKVGTYRDHSFHTTADGPKFWRFTTATT